MNRSPGEIVAGPPVLPVDPNVRAGDGFVRESSQACAGDRLSVSCVGVDEHFACHCHCTNHQSPLLMAPCP